jgi:hypothetical protein
MISWYPPCAGAYFATHIYWTFPIEKIFFWITCDKNIFHFFNSKKVLSGRTMKGWTWGGRTWARVPDEFVTEGWQNIGWLRNIFKEDDQTLAGGWQEEKENIELKNKAEYCIFRTAKYWDGGWQNIRQGGQRLMASSCESFEREDSTILEKRTEDHEQG